MRAFIGIDFSSEVKSAISELQNELRADAEKGRWKYHENFHLTLKFFEDINDEQKIFIDEAVRATCMDFSEFSLGMGELGVFSGRDSIRVLWMGLTGDTAYLARLFGDLDDAFCKCGFEKEKRSFKPHVTIGQDLVFNRPFDQLKNVRSKVVFPETVVDRLYLFQSEQIGRKRVYTKIEEYPLHEK